MLLGLGRGSGPRSVAGMVEHRVTGGVTWWRPLLGVRRDTTRAACAAQELPVWDDPWNADPAYTRVRLRTDVLPLLEEVLGGGVAPALARTAAQLREDLDALDALAAAHRRPGDDDLPVDDVAGLPAALRRRVLRSWLIERGGARPAGGPPGRRRRAADPVAGAGPGRPTGRRRRRPHVWHAGAAAP